MCTVSFVAANNAVIVTSNRDEHLQRENAAAPGVYLSNDKKIIFPKDARAGGTWFAAASDGAVAVLLNGAFEKHIPDPPYRKSRGLVVLDIIEADDPLLAFTTMSLEAIEPFTLILYSGDGLQELRWDGNLKYQQELDATGNYIWSSVTLYSPEVIAKRGELFDEFIRSGKALTPVAIHEFHAHDHGDAENGFIINRQTGMKTFSITQAVIQDAAVRFAHHDLLQQQQFEEILPIHKALQ